MDRVRASEDLRPISDLKSRGGEIVRQVTETGRPVYLTRHGRGVAVVLSVERFEELQDRADGVARAALQRALREADADVTAGRLVSGEQIKAELAAWAQGAE